MGTLLITDEWEIPWIPEGKTFEEFREEIYDDIPDWIKGREGCIKGAVFFQDKGNPRRLIYGYLETINDSADNPFADIKRCGFSGDKVYKNGDHALIVPSIFLN